MTNFSSKQLKVALICLDSAVPLYADTLSFLGWKFLDNGVKTIRFGCDGLLQACTSINSTGKVNLNPIEKEKICQKCRIAQRDIISSESYTLNDIDTVENEDALNFLNLIKERLHFGGKIADLLDMEFDGFPLCRIAFFDFAIVTKLDAESTLDIISVKRFLAGVYDLINLIISFKRFNNESELTHIVYVNGNYSQNTLARHIFDKKGVICLSVEPQLTSQHVLSRVMLVPNRLILHPEGLHHSDVEDVLIDKKMLTYANNMLINFGARIKGLDFNAYTSLNYSSNATKEVDSFANFLQAHKKIVSYFLSSEDELTPHIITHGVPEVLNSNPLGPYRSQIEFTSYFLNESRKKPNIGFIIRVHPRMAANKRDPFEAEEHLRYKTLFDSKKLPPNVFILFGESEISSYYVISESDLVVISWSTIGLEALLLGVPTISTFPEYLMYPLTKISKQPTNRHEMECALFENSNFGIAEDTKLLKWMTLAYEAQFFTTTAPRGLGGLTGKLYSIFFRLLKKIGKYKFFYFIMDRFFLDISKINSNQLFSVKKDYTNTINGSADRLLLHSLNHYRLKNGQLLKSYKSKIFNTR